MKRFLGIIFILVGFLIAFVTVRGSVFFDKDGQLTEQVRRAHLSGVKELMIETSSTDIDVREAEGNELEIGLEGKRAHKIELLSEQRGEQFIVQAKYKQRFFFNFDFFSNAKLVIYIPASYQDAVTIKTSSGDITMSGERTFSALRLETSSGDVKKLAGSFADFNYRSSSGDLAASKLNVNEARFSTSSGDIFVKGLQGNVEGKSTSGDVFFEYANQNGNIRWSSSSGDLLLQIPEPSYSLELSTSSGDLVISTPHELISQQRRQLKAIVGDGDKQITVKTSSGDVVVK